MDLLGLPKGIEQHEVYGEDTLSTHPECPECQAQREWNTKMIHETGCELKALIDALEAGTVRLVEVKDAQ